MNIHEGKGYNMYEEKPGDKNSTRPLVITS